MNRPQEIAGYILVKLPDGFADSCATKDRLLMVPGMQLVHETIGQVDLICYLEAVDLDEFRLRLDTGIGGLKDIGLIHSFTTLLVLSEEAAGYADRDVGPDCTIAWLFIGTSVGDQEPIVSKLLSIPEVVNAHAVLGGPDIVAFVNVKTVGHLANIIDNKVGKIDGIRSRDTRLVVRSEVAC